MNHKILVVDDNSNNRKATCAFLEEIGYKTDFAENGRDGVEKAINNEYAVVVLDYLMPDLDGAQVAQKIKCRTKEPVILMYSCVDSKKALQRSWDSGAVQFVDKDDNTQALQDAVAKCYRIYEETTQTAKLNLDPSAAEEIVKSVGMIGRSPAMVFLAKQILKIKDSRESVLLVGPRGAGKELVAKALHSGPGSFKSLNCTAFNTGDLLESELFGHEKGAFTGAITAKAGIVELARGGTVFFDELHKLRPDAQGKLLRAFQEKKIRRVGGKEEYAVDFRIVAAVQPDILHRLNTEQFIWDLYDRVNVLRIELPPLKDHKQDIELLVPFFAEKWNAKSKKNKSFLTKTVRFMEQYDWPGNVRELENMVYSLLSFTEADQITPEHLDKTKFNISGTKQFESFFETKKRHEEQLIGLLKDAIRITSNKTEAAEKVGLPYSTFSDLLKKYGIKK